MGTRIATASECEVVLFSKDTNRDKSIELGEIKPTCYNGTGKLNGDENVAAILKNTYGVQNPDGIHAPAKEMAEFLETINYFNHSLRRHHIYQSKPDASRLSEDLAKIKTAAQSAGLRTTFGEDFMSELKGVYEQEIRAYVERDITGLWPSLPTRESFAFDIFTFGLKLGYSSGQIDSKRSPNPPYTLP
ncbi:MAG: hypothetical protein HYU97_10325 [Deltaproteobacteria bacterium]|nr:hypothetical protein [Deltaproteobacteria bacterium]